MKKGNKTVAVHEAGPRVDDGEGDAVAHDDPIRAVDAGVQPVAALEVAEDHVERGVIELGGGCYSCLCHRRLYLLVVWPS
jgi:hypothetical protein